jgi:hypothetical protein
MTSVRVLNFKPSINGLHYTNDWPSVPDYKLNLLGQTIGIGDASNGLCGGMVYTVRDLFQAGLLPPADRIPPAAGSQAFNYIVARLTNSFDYDDVNQYLSWIQMSDHDTDIAHGLAWHEITEEWPKIKADLDQNLLSPLGLVAGQEPATIGALTGIQDLHLCHQVLAWGYDLNGTALSIHIYDPDYIGDTFTIHLDIGNPAHTTPIAVSNWAAGTYRGFFHTHYTFHDPRNQVSGDFIIPVVISPGFPNGGPIPAPGVTRTWLDASGNPLVRFTGGTNGRHDWSGNVAATPADAGRLIHALNLTIKTGSDDLRGGSNPTDNCDVVLKLASGNTTQVHNINGGQHWNNNEIHTVALPVPAGSKSGDIVSLDLHTQFGGGIGGDNWNVNGVQLQAVLQ